LIWSSVATDYINQAEVPAVFAVLSDQGKKSVYDAGLFGLLSDDDDEVRELRSMQSVSSIKLSYGLVGLLIIMK